MNYKIEIDIMNSAMRAAIDLAVYNAVDRFKDRLGEDQGIVSRIARAAAESALEQFKVMCNSELRLIQIEHEQRLSKIVRLK